MWIFHSLWLLWLFKKLVCVCFDWIRASKKVWTGFLLKGRWIAKQSDAVFSCELCKIPAIEVNLKAQKAIKIKSRSCSAALPNLLPLPYNNKDYVVYFRISGSWYLVLLGQFTQTKEVANDKENIYTEKKNAYYNRCKINTKKRISKRAKQSSAPQETTFIVRMIFHHNKRKCSTTEYELVLHLKKAGI